MNAGRAGITPGKVSMWASQTMPSMVLAKARASRRSCRRMMTSSAQRNRTTASVTTIATSRTDTYQVSGRVPLGISAASTETPARRAAPSRISAPRLPIGRSCGRTSPEVRATGGTTIPAICVAAPQREVKELSQFVTNSDSVHRALSDGAADQFEERRLVEDGDLEALRL